MEPLLDLAPDELQSWLAEQGEPPFRCRQIRRWMFQGRAASFEEMSDLPRSLRAKLSDSFVLRTSTTELRRTSEDGTEKLVLRLADGGRIECVLLRDGPRRSICISTQVGCAMGCVFCASGLDGVDRNLTAGEILEQMLLLAQLLPPEERLSHIVVMGMGEPLANLPRLLPALRDASSPDGLAISPRRITISTVGLPRAIHELAEQRAPYNLAVSLHAPDDQLRNELVPVNRRAGLARIIAAADRYFETSGRRLTYEYVLLGEINDKAEHARALVRLLAGRPALVNVIPYNPVAGLPYRTPSISARTRFREILLEGGLNVQFRQRKGDAIDAACGQLRRSLPAPLAGNA